MYLVTIDNNILHDPRIKDYQVLNPVLNLEVNKTHSFNFTIYPNNPMFNSIERLKSIIEVYDDGELIFRGRPLNDTADFNKATTIQCEGELAYLNDSTMEPYSYFGPLRGLLELYIDNHNTQVDASKQFTLGTVSVLGDFVRSNIEYTNTWEELSTKTFGSSMGGYLQLRRENDINYIDYLSDSLYISGQTIELSKNLLDYEKTVKASDIVTVLIPLGAKLKDEEGNELDERLTIESVNAGSKFIEHTNGISKYGRIVGYKVWDDINTPELLKTRATNDLNFLVNLGISIKIKAIDLNILDKSIPKIRFFEYVKIISKPHEIDDSMLIKKQTIHLDDPSQNTIEVGVEVSSFTDKQLEANNTIKIIKSDYVTNEKMTNVINTIELTPGPATYTWIRYADDVNGSGISNDPTGKAYIGFAYNKLTATESNIASDYIWSLIQGPKGDTGVKGDTGANGQTFYTWIKYSPNADGSDLTDTPQANTSYIGIATNKTTPTETDTPSDYTWSLFKGPKGDIGEQGPRGLQGLEGPEGKQGIQGANGVDGLSSYTHIAYATSNTGANFSHSTFDEATYIGMYVSDDKDSSEDWEDYEWTLIKGADGSQGIQGPKGDNGLTPYFHTAWANNATGTSGFSTTDSVNKLYIGTYTDHTQADSDEPSDYDWTKIKGDKGDKGDTGDQGKGISSTDVTYQAGSSGTTEPTGTWSPTVPTVSENQYLWTRTIITYTDNKTSTAYSVGKMGAQGPKGDTGTDGKGISSTTVTYQASTSGTVTPTGTWQTTVPTVAENQYLWTRIVINYTSGSPTTSYSIGKMGAQGPEGAKGDKGDTGLRGATGEKGPKGDTGTSVSSVVEWYLATNLSSGVTTSTSGWKTTMQPMTTTNKYLWNYEVINFSDGSSSPTIPVIIGVHGNTGATGRALTGVTEYYLASASASGVTRPATDGTNGWTTAMQTTSVDKPYLWNYEKLTWSVAPTTSYIEPIIIGVHGATGPQGDEGPQGVQGPKGDNGISQYVHIRYSANADGNPMTTSPQATTKYIGLANTTSSTAPTGYSSYIWSLIKGSDGVDGVNGIPGQPGEDGNPNYTWVKYADDELGENMSDYPSGKMYIGLAFNKLTDTESSDPLDYQWSAMYDLEAIGEIRELTTILQSSITQNADNIAIEVSERQETDRILSEKVSEIDVDISSIRLEVSQIGGYNIISNPIGRFGTLDWTFESEHIKAYANSPYNKAYANPPYLKAQADNGSIMYGVSTDTQAKYGFRVWKAGKALSKITEAESGSDYSLHTKVKGTGVLRFKLREYTSATPTSKSSFFKETLLNTTNPTVEYSTYEKTITLDTTTQSVVLVVESDVSSRNGQFALFTNTSFNIGQPKPYGESITDMNNRIDNINARVTIAEDTVDLFTSRVNTVEGQVHTNTAQLTVQAGEISSKVSTNGVISAINQTAETIKINANRINLTGYVTVSSLSGQGTTTIDGSNIKTGTITADKINVTGLVAEKIMSSTDSNYYGEVGVSAGYVGLGLYDLRHGTTPYFRVLEMPTNGFLITDYNDVRRFSAVGAYTRIQHSNDTISFDSTTSGTRIVFGNSEIGIDNTGPYYIKSGGSKVYF